MTKPNEILNRSMIGFPLTVDKKMRVYIPNNVIQYYKLKNEVSVTYYDNVLLLSNAKNNKNIRKIVTGRLFLPRAFTNSNKIHPNEKVFLLCLNDEILIYSDCRKKR